MRLQNNIVEIKEGGGTRGSSTKTSSPAPPSWPLTSSSTIAASSTTEPREMLMKTPFGPSAAQHFAADQSASRRAAGTCRYEKVNRSCQLNQLRFKSIRQIFRRGPMPRDLHIECGGAACDSLSDTAHTHDAQSFAANFAGERKATLQPPALTHEAVCRSDSPCCCEHQSDGEVGNVVGQHVRSIGHCDPAFTRCDQVNRVKSDAKACR